MDELKFLTDKNRSLYEWDEVTLAKSDFLTTFSTIWNIKAPKIVTNALAPKGIPEACKVFAEANKDKIAEDKRLFTLKIN